MTSECRNGFTLPQKAERAPSSNKWSFSGTWQLSPSADFSKEYHSGKYIYEI
jgi:hypothetical protein